ADGSDVVRLQGTVLGDYVWDAPDSAATPDDSAEARRDNRMAQRFITVQLDLEYALLENRFWMPFRQTLALLVEVEFIVKGAMPVRALTTFSEYEINADAPLAFADVADSLLGHEGRRLCPDGGAHCPARDRRDLGFLNTGLWEEGRWEVRVPPRDSLAGFAWPQPLTLELEPEDEARIRESIADLSRQLERLPDEWVGRRTFSLDWQRLADIARFNRVQGLSLGAGVQFRPGPAFTTLDAAARFGLADERVTGSLTWRREAPDGGLEISAFRSVLEAEPWSRGQSLGNSLNAAFAGHDDADYYLALGGSVRYLPYHGMLEDVELTLGFERHRSMVTASGSPVNDFFGGTGVLPPNPPIAQGDYVRAAISRHGRMGPIDLRTGVEALVGDAAGSRAWTDLRGRFRIAGRSGTISMRSSAAVGEALPQLLFRAGGPATVRGYDYGTRSAKSGWAAQLDVALTRRWIISPVIFADVGDTFRSGPFDPLVGVGGGVSLLGGWIRLNGAFGLNPRTDFRFDLLFGAPR
ncbi:MAG TPA: ShlB/FhaC/HecB family hemolysin secretion/activation protein, partial [Gemmatimonadales bacterium]|nr:ShlB/FhaC/HecB family hemolysin secretion/activation protein [Gemmatimonadales bacterium]